MQKVMVVDDEEVLRMLIVDTLEDLEDVVIHTADNGRVPPLSILLKFLSTF